MARVRLPYKTYLDSRGRSFHSVVRITRIAHPAQPGFWIDGFEAMIDSGASRCVFHADFAHELGIDLTSGIRELSSGISGLQEMWLHDVLIDLPGGALKIEAAFQEHLPLPGLLGMQGFFEHFIITFDPLARECQLDRIYRA